MPTSPMSEVLQRLRSALRPEGAEPTDGQLLERFLTRREPAALEALVRRHAPMVWGVCRRILSDPHDAEDAFQATFLVLCRKAASIRTVPGNWLYGVARQTALKARVTRAKRQGRERLVTEMPEPAVTDPEPRRDLEAVLDEEISRLPEHHRAAVVLCELEGRTVKEAARQLGCPEGTVASRLARGRALLAKRLARHGPAVTGATLGAVLSPKAASAAVPTPVLSATLKAVTSAAAGQAAAAGVISRTAATLTEGVLKAMLLNKLLRALVVLLVVAALGGAAGLLYPTRATEPPTEGKGGGAEKRPAGAPDKQAKEDVDQLQGTWRLVTSEMDGVTFAADRPEVKDSVVIFKNNSVTLRGKLIHSPHINKEPEDVKAVGTFTLDTTKTPKQIVLSWVSNPWLTKEYFTERGIYALDGDRFRLCMYFPGSNTKLLVPTEFSAGAGSKRSVTTWERVPPSGRRGEEKARGSAGEERGTDRKPPRAEAKANLQGSWQLVTYEVYGLKIGEGRPELKDNRLVIGRASLTLFYTPESGAPITKAVARFTMDAGRTPPVMVLTWKECPWNGKKDFVQEALCAVEGDTLKLCLSPKEDDAKAPPDFSAGVGSGRLLWTFRREPAGEKKPAPQGKGTKHLKDPGGD